MSSCSVQKQGLVPETSTTLLRDVGDTANKRWVEFCARYEPMMRAYVHGRFPSLEADEIVQLTFVELSKVLPQYIYAPDEKGRFHNYLTGILRHMALHRLRIEARERQIKESLSSESCGADDSEEEAYRQPLVELALARFFL